MSQAVFLSGMGGSVPSDVATSYVTNAGAAVPAANVLNVLGTTTTASGIPFEFTGSGNTVTGVIQIADAIPISDETNVGLAAFNSSQFSVDGFGFVSLLGTGAATKLTGNTGTATPTAGNINVVTAHSTVKFVGSGSTLTEDFGIGNIVLGSALPSLTGGLANNAVGNGILNSITSGTGNTFMGSNSSGGLITSSGGNCGYGNGNLQDLTTGTGFNIAIGSSVLVQLATGDNVIAIGSASGNSYNAAESSNIVIQNGGVAGESNTIRIGTQGSGARTVNRCFVAGINGVTNSNSQPVTIDSSTGQLGVASIAQSSSTLVTTFSSGSGIWTANARTQYVEMFMWGGGGGGGSGRKGATTAAGGGSGGAGGGFVYFQGPVGAFSGSLTYLVGAAAAGGVSQATDLTNGNPGTVGNNSSFGNIVALGGGAGVAGSTGATGSATTRASVGTHFDFAGLNSNGNGSNLAGSNGTSTGGASLQYAIASSGGGGGGADTVTQRAGGNGSGLTNAAATVLIAAAAGGLESTGINGSNANASLFAGGIMSGGMGGGGGGGYSVGAGGATTGGNGGNGSSPGGGGGGGGGGLSATAASGAGGNGAAGQIIIIEYF